MSNPGGVDLSTNPYYDDYDEDKKFARVLYVPGRAVQARELTQAQSIQQAQVKRFADYFFDQGAIIDGCEQTLDLNLPYVKLQTTFDGTVVDVTDFANTVVFGADNGIKAYCGIVADLEGTDPKTLYINYLNAGSIVLTVNNAASTITPGNTITFSTGNTAVIDASYIDPISGANKLFVSSPAGTLTATTANTVDSTGTTLVLNVTAVSDRRGNTEFVNSEQIFTANTATRAYANAAISSATTYTVNQGLANEYTFNRASKYTVADGYMYIADHFVKHTGQTIILDKYSNFPSYQVGIVPSKEFIDYIEDTSLVDNAQGTPNFQAPGADRLKIDTVLTKLAIDVTTAETEFVLLSEIFDGVARKRKPTNDTESRFEDALARRTFEESGDYTLSDPRINVREHLLQDNNGGRYVSADGGNNDLLLVEIDPFTAYISGYRNQTIVKTEVSVRKGLDTEYVEQVARSINYGNYIEVQELCGAWDFMEATKVDLYDTAQQVVTNETFSDASVTGSKIGEARVRGIEYVSGIQGTATARYYLFLYGIVMNSGEVFGDVRAIYDAGTPKRFADIVLNASGNAVVNESGFNSLIFKLPYNAIRTLRDADDEIETGFVFDKRFSVTVSNGIATISSTDGSETFSGTGILSATEKNNNYQIIVNNAGADVETGNLSGTVSVSANTKAVVGVSTAFLTQINVNDIIKIGSEEVRVDAIADDTNLTLEDDHVAGASSVTFTKILSTGSLIALDLNGGTGSTRTVNVSSPGTVQINIRETATFTAEVVARMRRTNAREKSKILNYQATANVNPNTHPNGLAGPFGLGYGDVYQIHAIYQSADFSTAATTSDTNVTSSYTFNNGQTSNEYNHGTITPNSGVTPTGRLLAVFDYFAHDVTQGLGYCSIDSYPIDDAVTSNTTINTTDIPIFTTDSGESLDLRDCVDFRPVKTANTSLNPIEDGTYQVPTGGLHIPVATSTFEADLIYYKGRILKVYINSKGQFGVNEGAPKSIGAALASPPPRLPDTLELTQITIPPYPSVPRTVSILPMRNKRFTMKDVSRISDRLQKLEYYTALGFLEKQATETVEVDDEGIDRFKNGILVDAFTGSGVAKVTDAYYKASIDGIERYVTAWKDNTGNTDMVLNESATETTVSYTPGRKVMLPYTHNTVLFAQQDKASQGLNLAQELTFVYNGVMTVVPAVDNWVDTAPEDVTNNIIYDNSRNNDNWAALTEAWNSVVAPSLLTWTGVESAPTVIARDLNVRTVQEGGRTFRISENLQATTQDAFRQEVNFIGGEQSEKSVDRIVDVSISLDMRARDFIVSAYDLKNNARMYAFFDGVDVTQYCRQIKLVGSSTINDVFDLMDNTGVVATDASVWELDDEVTSGQLRVKSNQVLFILSVPAGTFKVGVKELKITDSVTNSSSGETTFAKFSILVSGITQTKSKTIIKSEPAQVDFFDPNLRGDTNRQVRNLSTQTVRVDITPPPPPPVVDWGDWGISDWSPPAFGRDPLSQSFFIDDSVYRNGCYISKLDLYFKSKSDDPNIGVTVQIRSMENGYPTRTILESKLLTNAEINVSDDASAVTTVVFDTPVFVQPGEFYVFTLKPGDNSTDFEVWVAEIGELDITSQKRIDKNQYTGVVFTSANDYTWSARQTIDVKFTMYTALFESSATAIFENIDNSLAFEYSAFQPIIGDVAPSGTNITYEIRHADAAFTVDNYTTIKNFERRVLTSQKRRATSSEETLNSIKSITLRATLSTFDVNISPYISHENLRIALDGLIVNNSTETIVDGTIEFTSGTNIVVGTGTDFANDVFAGEYAYFGEESRIVSNIVNNTYLTVSSNFTTSNTASQQLIIRREENPTGPYTAESRYITRIVTLKDGFDASDLVAYMNVNRPSGTSIKVYAKLLNGNDTDPFNDKFYQEMTLVGTETFDNDPANYTEEKYIIPAAAKTGGVELLAGTVEVNNVNTEVIGTSTRFIEDLKIGDTIAVGVARTERTIATIANNTFLTVDSAFAANTSGQDVFRVLNNITSYTTPDGRTYEGFKYFSVKIVFLSGNEAYAPKVQDLRVMALA
jgi:hypothetical protein